jgi:hypothetical protein
MKTISLLILLVCALSLGACSRSDQPAATQAPPPADLKSDAERLQQATAKAAQERKRAEPAATATASAPQP